jgi:hypothetical protein
LGPDELQVSVFGIQELAHPVSVEGKVSIQNVGQISVSGMTTVLAKPLKKKGQRQQNAITLQMFLLSR